MATLHDEVAELARLGLPRRVRFRNPTTLRNAVLMVVVMFIFPHNLIGLGLITLAANQVALLVAGTDVKGRVVERKETHSKGNTYHYVRVAYSFDGEPRTTPEKSVDPRTYEALREGTPVTLRCSERFGNEGAELVDADGHVGAGAGGILFGAVFWNAAMAALWYMLLLRHVLAAWLVRSGVPVVARVESVTSKNAKAQGTVRVSFTSGGRTFRTSVYMVSRSVLDNLQVGEDALAFHHPAFPAVATLAAAAHVEAMGVAADGGNTPVAVR